MKLTDIMAWLKEEGARYFAVVILGIFGGCVQSANDPDISYRRFVIGIATAAFVSVLTALLLAEISMPFTVKSALVGISGYSAAKTLEILNRSFLARLEKLAEQKRKEREDA